MADIAEPVVDSLLSRMTQRRHSAGRFVNCRDLLAGFLPSIGNGISFCPAAAFFGFWHPSPVLSRKDVIHLTCQTLQLVK